MQDGLDLDSMTSLSDSFYLLTTLLYLYFPEYIMFTAGCALSVFRETEGWWISFGIVRDFTNLVCLFIQIVN